MTISHLDRAAADFDLDEAAKACSAIDAGHCRLPELIVSRCDKASGRLHASSRYPVGGDRRVRRGPSGSCVLQRSSLDHPPSW
jgi:hypothetical protein